MLQRSTSLAIIMVSIFLTPLHALALEAFSFRPAYEDAVTAEPAPPAPSPAPATTDQDNANYLRELKFASAVKFVNGNTNTSVVPVINLNYSDEIFGDTIKKKRKMQNRTDPSNLHIFYDIALEIKPEPAAGEKSDVAQNIRMDAGTFSFDGGMRFRYVQNDTVDKAPFGPEAKVRIKGAYQKAASSDTTGLNRTEFYVFSPEVAVGMWLKVAFLGYKFLYNTTSGGDSTLTNEINRTSVHKLVALFNVNQAFRQAETEERQKATKPNPNPYLLEINYTGGKNKFGDGTLSFSVVKSFNFF